jgi:hypothetical protein
MPLYEMKKSEAKILVPANLQNEFMKTINYKLVLFKK